MNKFPRTEDRQEAVGAYKGRRSPRGPAGAKRSTPPLSTGLGAASGQVIMVRSGVRAGGPLSMLN